jgi:hypothetical protein
MGETEQIPKPDTSGSSGNQMAGSAIDDLQILDPLAGLPIVSAVEGLVASNARAFGGNVPAALLGAATRQIGQDYVELKGEHRRLTSRLEDLREELQRTKTRSAVLEDRIRSEGRNKHVRNLCITVGMGLVGTGLALSKVAVDAYSNVSLVVGALLVFAGWFSGPKAEVKEQ